MLTAEKEEKKSQAVTGSANIPALGSFGKVMNSVQGLQQRLGDVSDDEVSQAHDKARTLILRLAELQKKLVSLVDIQRSIIAVRTEVNQAFVESVHLSELQASATPLQLQASDLIRFRSAIQAADENGNNSPSAAASPEHRSDASRTEISGPSPRAPSDPDAIETEDPLLETAGIKGASASSQEEFASISTDELPAQSQLSSKAVATESAGNAAKPDQSAAEAGARVPVGADFDQRLLDDLIKNYGEFAAVPNLPANRDIPKVTTEENNEPDTSRFQYQNAQSVKRSVPSLNKEGELDRKLKKLIKDYGEYDLYSRHRPANLKIGVIAAFLLLGVLFGGFYFLSSPKSISSSNVASDVPSAPDSAAVTTESSKDTERGSGKAFSNRGAAAVDLHQSVEAGEKQGVPNKGLERQKN